MRHCLSSTTRTTRTGGLLPLSDSFVCVRSVAGRPRDLAGTLRLLCCGGLTPFVKPACPSLPAPLPPPLCLLSFDVDDGYWKQWDNDTDDKDGTDNDTTDADDNDGAVDDNDTTDADDKDGSIDQDRDLDLDNDKDDN